MSGFETVRRAAAKRGLATVGWFHPEPQDSVPGNARTLILFGPSGQEMWTAFGASAEAQDGDTDPLDRWSRRVLEAVAQETGGAALFPFGGPPWHAFQHWAARGEGARQSPAVLQVSAERGLWLSYRGALAYTAALNLPPRMDPDPCRGCPAPCRTACPVNALARGRYDVAACVAHVRSAAGAACRTGCLVRKACPAGRKITIPEAERQFHMDAFLRANG